MKPQMIRLIFDARILKLGLNYRVSFFLKGCKRKQKGQEGQKRQTLWRFSLFCPSCPFASSSPFDKSQPVRFNLPVFFAHRSTCPNTHNPTGTITTPINISFNNSGATAEIGAPTSGPCPDPMPISLRHADNE